MKRNTTNTILNNFIKRNTTNTNADAVFVLAHVQ